VEETNWRHPLEMGLVELTPAKKSHSKLLTTTLLTSRRTCFHLLPSRLLAQKMLPLGRKITVLALIYYMKALKSL
jgi:hypothetical protein